MTHLSHGCLDTKTSLTLSFRDFYFPAGTLTTKMHVQPTWIFIQVSVSGRLELYTLILVKIPTLAKWLGFTTPVVASMQPRHRHRAWLIVFGVLCKENIVLD